jgi:membrane protease YdiL (CAAX protease family)
MGALRSNLSDTGKAFVYYTIAFLLCCCVALLSTRLGTSTLTAATFTPLAAVLLIFAVTGEGYTRQGWSSLGLLRAGWSGWPLALTIPVLVLTFAYGTLWLTGRGRLVTLDGWDPLPFTLDLFASLTVLTLSNGLGEEIGWRGYFLPRLLTLGQRKACLLSGLLHGVFHLPIMLGTLYYHAEGNHLITVPLFLLTLTLAGVCYGYLRITTGSVWPVALAHSTFNIAWDRLNSFTAFDDIFARDYLAGESGVLTVTALLVVAFGLDRTRFMKSK